ncbi:TPA: nuclear transport factor 2 family protein [Candidatus Galligastranaerophilus intestinigallinarum]|nr:nuclear transport factor 2 family protein [Candidatus Galligastranaerophilus intestinigallinarum]
MREQIEEYNAVENLARKFIEAVKKGDSKIVKPYFYEKANFFGQLNEKEYQSGPIQGFYDTIDKMGPCGDDYIARVDVITLEKTIAAVRVIEDNWHGYKFTDLLIMNKINGEWKIVAKVYDTLSYGK